MNLKLKKTIIAFSTLCLLTASGPMSVFASPSDISDQLSIEDFNLSKQNEYVVQDDIIDINSLPITVSKSDLQYSPQGVDPGEGATKVVLTTYGSYAQPAQQDRKSGIFNIVKGLTLIVFTSIIDTFYSVVTCVADLVMSSIDTTQVATAQTLVSYTYPTKQGQVWYSNAWHTLFESTNRNVYKHYYAIYWDKNKNSRQGVKDFVPAKGYSAIKVQSAAHYYNDTYIQTQAYNNYLQGKKHTTEEWINN
ncbi:MULTISPECIES: hypothetical protein [unclassified Paenibacillus]|uniref:hypothetical protein n=1 Tax=unclassified Paenibacillus TaxID=185978 RepID=UPI0003E1F6C5|nr:MULTISPECIES: hypothetical protein [unclassified Paenibacillus]ETT41448.1 hypothetical protein C162_26240 [Paenibacillus sp. FSL R7-269]OMG00450.1 hypothetical protein BK147_04420 [Paenibacillus sp. FSL R7-0337]